VSFIDPDITAAFLQATTLPRHVLCANLRCLVHEGRHIVIARRIKIAPEQIIHALIARRLMIQVTDTPIQFAGVVFGLSSLIQATDHRNEQ
jgi:hypothetical protein